MLISSRHISLLSFPSFSSLSPFLLAAIFFIFSFAHDDLLLFFLFLLFAPFSSLLVIDLLLFLLFAPLFSLLVIDLSSFSSSSSLLRFFLTDQFVATLSNLVTISGELQDYEQSLSSCKSILATCPGNLFARTQQVH